MSGQSHAKRCFNREYAIAFALLFNTFSSYFIGEVVVDRIVTTLADRSLTLLFQLAYPLSIIVSALVGSVLLVGKRKRPSFSFWLLLGVSASLLLAFAGFFPSPIMLASIAVLGTSLGFGMPMCLTYFTKSVPIEDRGKLAGATLFATIFVAPLAVALVLMVDSTISSMLLSFWRVSGLPFVFLIRENDKVLELGKKRALSLLSVLQNKTFYLYFTAWLMFAFIMGFGAEVMDSNISDPQTRQLVRIVEPAVSGVSALFGGIVSDWIGRKRVLIFGFVSFGLAYAAFAFIPKTLSSWLLFFTIDGLALGLLLVFFTVVLWGEVDRNSAEKYYALGESPLFLTRMISLLLAAHVQRIDLVSAFPMAAFFLFIAVIPLLYARETLPESKIEERQLKTYTEEALKLVQKAEQRQK